ncbi:MAG: RnfABCDGE type electron transport complex subunit D, partial [Clostridia bacterium]
GVILAMNLPPVVPFYVPLIGGFFAIMVVKMLFGGIGKNFANPALTARIFLMLAWAGTMTRFVAPIDLSKGFGEMFKYFGAFFGGVDSLPGGVDVLTTATPLAQFKINDFAGINITNAFLGNIGGCAGEVSSLALIIGGVYLIVRKVIDYKIPLLFLGTVAVLTPLFNMSFASILPALFSGGLMLGAFFMATDYTTSPNTTLGIIIYSIGCGFFTVLFREFSSMTEGVSFAILIMNIVTPLLDKFIIPKPFGYVKVKKEKVKKVKVEKAKEEVK